LDYRCLPPVVPAAFPFAQKVNTVSTESEESVVRHNFIKDIIDADLESGKVDSIVTRFPPEPNGYLHIGHAKSICLNFGLAQDYKGRCHLRFDDTNPLTEDTEYVESIQNDVKWLGWEWDGPTRFASDYFEWMYELAEKLIEKGKAYVDSQDVDAIREQRGTISEPGTHSPYRDRSVEENLDLFRRMRAGEFGDGEHVLRAKIDMSSPNILMRDPLLYRIRHATHHRTGDDWCIYPMYDYAHCLEDAYEHVTHSICTLEFENNRELYDWVIEETETEARPHQYEFARLALTYTIMSKRKLLKLVQNGHVSGWDDPRMPTIAGMRRRGITPEAIREFCDRIGVAKANSTVDVALLEFCIRDDLNMKVRRVMAVHEPLKVVITNWDADEVDWLDASYYPHDVPLEGSRKVPFTKELYIEREDFMEEPPKDYYRLAPGREVRLRYGYYITCDEVVKDGDTVVELRCSVDRESRGGNTADGRKVSGTIHWVSATESKPAEIRLYDRLFEVPNPGADPDVDFLDELNPESLQVLNGWIEPSVADDPPGTRYQFERNGYYMTEPVDHEPGSNLVFNRIVTLRDSWAKREKEAQKQKEAELAAQRAAEKAKQKAAQAAGGDADSAPNKRPASYERDKNREEHAELAERLETYQNNLGLEYDDADLLSGYTGTARFYEAVLENYDAPQSIAKWMVNELLHLLDDDPDWSALPFGSAEVATLVKLIDDDRITAQSAELIRDVLLEEGGDPEAIVAERGLEKIADTGALEALVDEAMANNPAMVEKYRNGTTSLVGFFIGQVMKATKGSADATVVRGIVQEKLDAE
jgi:glutaminyl-tRNA synthetase